MARDEFLLTPREVARMLATTTDLLRKWRERGTGPEYVKIEGLIRYRPEDVDQWISDHRTPTIHDASDV